MSTFEKLQALIAATLLVPAAKITRESRAEDIASWDSLGHVNLMMSLEQTFGVFLDVEDFPKLNSVRAILAYLDDHGFH